MRQRILICAVLLLITSVIPTEARRKKTKARKQHKTEVKVQAQSQERYQEIDNYDFLYTGAEYDYNYDVAFVDNLMDEAFKHIGARYRSGSKGPSSFDCSGFTSYVYGKMNMQIGCSSRDQYAKNTPIKDSEMQSGDLVFFTSPSSGRSVGHVGIVIDVDPEKKTFTFIHASSRGGVKVSNSNEGYYSRRYIGARRVTQNEI